MSGLRVLVVTRKGAFVMTADGTRDRWNIQGPHFTRAAAGAGSALHDAEVLSALRRFVRRRLVGHRSWG